MSEPVTPSYLETSCSLLDPRLISVVCQAASRLSQADHFARAQGLHLLTDVDLKRVETPFTLVYDDEEVFLFQQGKGAPGPVSASFIDGKVEHRRRFGGGKGQLIAKAVGLNKGVYPTVLDATAGLGRDAWVLASLGCTVQMLERSPVIAELLAFALFEAKSSALQTVAERLSLIHDNSVDWLNQQCDLVADVIYLDPMYPHRDKSASVKKEMKAFQALVGQDVDGAELLEAALKKAKCRVVVKRPRKGELLSEVKPSFQLLGKTSRYDVYTLQSITQC